MILTFQPPKDASIFDIVLNTYGSLNLLGKFVGDNKISNINGLSSGKELFIFDYALVDNYGNYLNIIQNGFKFVTGQKFIIDGVLEENYLLTEDTRIIETEQGDLVIVS